ncbi:MAG: aldo/keto reductase [Clostridia bacterium]|nr:aldo/keto reductase [Clostridia bacterium]
MEHVQLGSTDLSVSRICLGTADFGLKTGKQAAFELLDAFHDMGGNFLDTANVYCKWVPGKGNCSEQIIGEWLRDRKPKDMVTATKGGHYSFLRPWVSRVTEKTVRQDLEESLGSLSRDCIDFYWLHRDNEALSPEEISDFMSTFVREGKIRYWGISNLTAARAEAFGNRLQGISNQWSLALESRKMAARKDQTTIRTDAEMIEVLRKHALPLVPYTSGANGCFAAMEKGTSCHGLWDHPANRRIFETLRKWAGELGVSCYVLGQAWLLAQPFEVFPIAAVSRREQLLDFERICALKIPETCLAELAEALSEAEKML